MTNPSQTLPRQEAVTRLAQRVAARRLGHPTRVAVDGVTASGKSTLARELAATVSALGRPVMHVAMDGFLIRARGAIARGESRRAATTRTPTIWTRSTESCSCRSVLTGIGSTASA